jgi:Mechanosensitive ion channel, conserved TM helix
MNDSSLKDQFRGMWQDIVAFLPNLLAGIALILVGWLLAWIAKRLVMRIAVVLKLERFLTSFRWGDDFAKADIRYSLYNFLGNIAAAVVFLIFLEHAFEAWHLKILSTMIAKGISIFPRVLSASIAFGAGWLISLWAAKSVQKSLLHEHVPGATLIARLVKGILIIFFSAVAMVELDVARQIVLVGFSAFILTFGALLVVVAASMGKDFFRQLFGFPLERNESKE